MLGILKIENSLVRIPRFITFLFALIVEFLRFFRNYVKKILFLRRSRVIRVLAERKETEVSSPKVLAVITHVTRIEESDSDEKIQKKIGKLRNTIDGLLESLAHCQVKIIINTVRDRYLTDHLPEYQRNLIQVKEQENCDPLYTEFRAQDEFISRIQDYDWFLFMEDDMVIRDSNFLDKLNYFNENINNPRIVLRPNCYEMYNGRKYYIEATYNEQDNTLKLVNNSLSVIEIGELKFCEYENSHVPLYCLTQEQLQIWADSGQQWKNKVMMVSPLESAGTACLFECFSLYFPHPDNLHFFEVMHWDNKYSIYIQETQIKYFIENT